MRLALWTPRPHAPWVSALVPVLEREASVAVVDGEVATEPEADLALFHVDDAPAHAFVHRALRRRPGVVLLAEWGLHRLVHAESAGGGDVGAYLAEARRAHGETGDFVARQVVAGRAGDEILALLELNDRVLEASLAVCAFTAALRSRAAARLPGRPVVHLPLDFVGLHPPRPPKEAARAALRVPPSSLLVAVLSAPGERAAGALRATGAAEPGLVLRSWPEEGAAQEALLAAADVAVALEYPPRLGLARPVARAVVAGLPTIVSAGSGAAGELPEGVVVRVSPGSSEAVELAAVLVRLVRDSALRGRVAALARAHGESRRDPVPAALGLLALAREVGPATGAGRADFAARREEGDTLRGWALQELRWRARDLGLAGLPPGLEPLLAPILGGGR